MRLLYFGVVAACLLTCKNEPNPEESVQNTLGVLEHHFDISDLAREQFDRGLLLLHSFEYDDAREAFQEAIDADSTEIMAHWGEAMTYYKALWGLQDVEAGRTILQRIGETKAERLESITDPLERELWEGLELLYGEGEFDERNQHYTTHLETLHGKYPDHQEIAAFYALGLIWASEEYGDGSPQLRKSARIADAILEENPNHPGALHYKIHALDGPISAADAKMAADRYSKVAPDAAHALHMPSHIYLALGRWDDVVSSNEASYAASVKRMEQKGLSDGARGYHSYDWLHYAYLQQGRYEDAQRLLQDMLVYVPADPDKGARGYLLDMQNHQLVETGEISPDIDYDWDVRTEDLGLAAAAMRSFQRSWKALQSEDLQGIEEQKTYLANQINVASTQVGENGKAMCSAGQTRYAPTQDLIHKARTVLCQLNVFIAQLQDDQEAVEENLIAATELEAGSEFPTGPPLLALPSFEQYGYWLLERERPEEAVAQFQKGLERTPRRARALRGLLSALEALDRNDEASAVRQELEEIWKRADKQALDLLVAL